VRGAIAANVLVAHIQWRPAPEWFAAIGTVGSLLLGLRLFARDQDDRRRAQGRSIGAWTTPPVPKLQPDGSVRVAYEFVVVNRSSEPVHQLPRPLSPWSTDWYPRLARHLADAVIHEDSRAARLAKEHKDSKRRIDACVAAVMAHDRAAVLAGDRGPSIYV
jgi:hypothetical protein